MTITAAANGSALGNPGPAGWAWFIDENTWRAGGWPHGTNNMGELQAVLDLLEATAVDADQHLQILCDSQYVINSLTKWMPGWKRKGWRKKDGKPVLNVELLQAIDRALAGRSVEFEWVKGHAGHSMNEAADERAHAAATAYQRKMTPDVGPGYREGEALPGNTTPGPGSVAPSDPAPGGVTPDAAVPAAASAPAPASDLFSLFDEEPEDDGQDISAGACVPDLDAAGSALTDLAAADGSALEEVTARELVLLTDAVRQDPPSVAELLHPGFTEIGASGRDYDRETLLSRIVPAPGVTASDLVAEEIAPDVVLLRYATEEPRGTVRRSSVWVHENGRWLLRHHQGTPDRDGE